MIQKTYIINSSVASGETQRTSVDDQKRRKYSIIETVLVNVKTDYSGYSNMYNMTLPKCIGGVTNPM